MRDVDELSRALTSLSSLITAAELLTVSFEREGSALARPLLSAQHAGGQRMFPTP